MTSQSVYNRRAPSLILSALLIVAACAPSPLHAQTAVGANDRYLARAKRILKTTPLIDGHNDLPWVIRNYAKPPRNVEKFDIRDTAPYQTDFPRLRKGTVGAQFWSVYIPGEIDPITYPAVQMEQIDIA